MKNLYIALFSLVGFCAVETTASAQQTAPRRPGIAVTSPLPDTSATDDAPRGMVLHADPRLAVVVTKSSNIKRGLIRSGRGYRVQIYSGNDRAMATRVKVDFMRRFPGVRTYMTYAAPQFRVKVGDYANRGDAQRLVSQIGGLYSPVMIVPDLIVVNTLRDPQ